MSVITSKELDPFEIEDGVNDLLSLIVNGEKKLVIIPTPKPNRYCTGYIATARDVAEAIHEAVPDISAYDDGYGRVLLVSTHAITVPSSAAATTLGLTPGDYPPEATGEPHV